jgi:citrate synthase
VCRYAAGVILAGLNALSTFHPEQNPALQGGGIYSTHGGGGCM